MPSNFFTSIKRNLEIYFKDFNLSKYVRGPRTTPSTGEVKIYIGDLPPKKPDEKDGEHPFIVITSISGEGGGGEFKEDLAFLVGVFCDEQNGDAEGAEMELSLLRTKIAGFLKGNLNIAIDGCYTCVADSQGRYMHWKKNNPMGQPSPFAQLIILSQWTITGWE